MSSTPDLVSSGDKIDADQPTNVRWLIFGLASLASYINYVHRYSWGVIKPYMLEDGVVTEEQMGWLDGLIGITYSLGQFPGGLAGDLMGPHLVIPASAVLWSVVTAAPAVMSTLYGLATIRLAMGLAQAPCYPCLGKITQTWIPRATRTTQQGFISSFAGRAGGACSSLIIGMLLMGWCQLTWQTALLVTAGGGIIFAVVFAVLFRNSPRRHPRVNEAEASLIEADEPVVTSNLPLRWDWSAGNIRNMAAFFGASFFSTFADNLFVFWMPTFLVQAKGFSPTEMGLFASLPLFGGALGGLCGGILNDVLIRVIGNRRWARRLIAGSCKVVAAALICSSLLFDDGRVIMGVLFLCKFFSDMSQPTWWGTVTDIGGPAAGRVFGMVNTVGATGLFAAGPIMAWVKTNYGFNGLFYFVAAVYLLTTTCWLMVDCTRRLVVVDETVSTSATTGQT
ncbi:MAG: MFS transporter [Fuerstiella sp.]|nr:MFS transporter [Fuerstiella sp.]